jgi:hypothetical protein
VLETFDVEVSFLNALMSNPVYIECILNGQKDLSNWDSLARRNEKIHVKN